METRTLTNREREVVQKVAEGLTSKEIAEIFHVSVHTIKTHRKNIMRRLDLKRATQLAMLASAVDKMNQSVKP